ncbi:hypothetical protein HYT25_01025 [Candidatus Pacearchaeota archaeon]|nr:hypothetical protein [Candidatus Pacearchaeota archaeon]
MTGKSKNIVFATNKTKIKTKMDIKKLSVFFVMLAGILLFSVMISAADFSNVLLTVDNIDANDNPALVSGETVAFKVYFDSNIDTANLKVRVEVEGEEVDVDETTSDFEVEAGHRYAKVLTMRIPFELEDQVSDDAVLNLKIWGGDSVAYTDSFDVRVQRTSYNVDFASISTPETAEAGKLFPVTVVLKNIGYNNLDDVYVTVRMPELEIQKSAYFGDLVAIENDDDEDVVSGRIFLDIPYTAKNGVYTLEVAVKSDDFSTNKVTQVVLENGFSSNVFVSGNQIILTNPTGKLLVLKLVPEGNVRLSDELVVIPAGSSRTVLASATGDFKVNIFSKDGLLLDSVVVPATSTGTGGNAVAVLTVILAIIFLVLLVVLIILVTKKPEKKEEFGESYY